MNVVFARYREGLVSERERISHAIILPDSGTWPPTVEALCGQAFPPGVLEQLPSWAGMPCLPCTLNMPTGSELEQ